MPDSLSSIRDADSGEEAIKILSDEYCQNPFDKEPLIQGKLLFEKTHKFISNYSYCGTLPNSCGIDEAILNGS